MKNPKQISLIIALLLGIFSVQNVHADITDICVNASYDCFVDDVPDNGYLIGLSIGIDYTSATGEQIDCVTLTLPPGWTYVVGSEVGNSSDADGNYITDSGKPIRYRI